ncbi:MAG TPA: sensor domain-containing diguanylate cyclase [Gemmatimonadaceae bacterium]|nr:sensor domain-containing diguanylate cyclase [Gemmatimonadaceae bacterium]
MAIIASSVARSPLFAIMSCLVALLSYQKGVRVGVVSAVIVVALAFTVDPYAAHPFHIKMIVSIVVLAIISVVSGDAYGRIVPDGTVAKAAAAPTRSVRGLETPARGSRAIPEPRRSLSMEVEPASNVEQETISRFLREMRDQVGGDEVVLWRYLRDTDELIPISSATSPVPKVNFETNPPLESLVHWAVQQGLPTTNYDTESSFFLTAAVGKEGRFHGALGVYAEDRESLSRERAKIFLPRYATRLTLLVDMLSDGKETRRYRGKADKVVVASQKIQKSQDLASLNDAICSSALDVTGGTRSAYIRWDASTGTALVESVTPLHTIEPGFAISPESIIGKFLRNPDRPRMAVRETYRKSEGLPFSPLEPSRKIGSLAIVPLVVDDEIIGAVCVEGDEEAQLTAVEGELLSMLAPVASVALKNVEQLQDVTQKSNHDALTGLANRRQFEDRLRHHLLEFSRHRQPVSLILLDIDMFKTVNDIYGHQGGDSVLVEVARAAEKTIREIDLCARYGGEELAILLPQTNLAGAARTAERLRDAVSRLRVTPPSGGAPITVTASFGVASYTESVKAGDLLFPAADMALYQAKSAGRNCVRQAMSRSSFGKGAAEAT